MPDEIHTILVLVIKVLITQGIGSTKESIENWLPGITEERAK